MRAFLTAVNFSDVLAWTLPYNRHHFDQVHVVTSLADEPNVRPLCEANGAAVYATDSFYAHGASFAKWLALEEALDHFGRHGWTVLMDADVCWPKNADVRRHLRPGYLFTPLRHVCDPIPPSLPPESEWARYPLHRNEREWAGYTQVFHASDPVLGPPPWHDVRYKTAGSSDSFFQAKWPMSKKVRPPWHVLHLGPTGTNWAGRVTPYVDGSVYPMANARREVLNEMFRLRKQNRNLDHEKF